MKSLFAYKKYSIADKSEIAPDTFLFQLDGKLSFDPGQFVQLKSPHYGEATFAPCSNTSDKKSFRICVRNVGNISGSICSKEIGDKILLRGPYGRGWPIGKLISKNVLVIAGGMGIVPLMPLLYELDKFSKEFKKISLIAGFRTPEHVLFEKDLAKFNSKFNYVKIGVEKGTGDWWGERADIAKLLLGTKISSDSMVLICGPEVMFKPCIEILITKKLNLRNVYLSFERRMECGVGFCQHCTIGKYKVCEDGPVFSWAQIEPELKK